MTPRAIEDALVVALRALPPGEKGVASRIRPTIGCTAAELARAIDKLRMQGKILWGRLDLAGSMRVDEQDSASSSSPEDHEAGSSGDEPEARAADAPTSAGADGEPEAVELREASAGAGGGGDLCQAPPPPQPVEEVSPDALVAEIRAYLVRTGMAKSRFGTLTSRDPKLLERLACTGRVKPRTVDKLRAFMASNPEGVAASGAKGAAAPRDVTERGITRAAKAVILADTPPARAPVAEQVKHEAEVIGARRRLAGSIGSGAQQLAAAAAPRGLVERIQTALAEEPADLMRAVNRRHPLLWQRVLALGRRDGDAMPSIALWRVIEAGLDLLEQRP